MPPTRSKRAPGTALEAPAAKRVFLDEAELVHARTVVAAGLEDLEAALAALEQRVIKARLIVSKGDVLLHHAIVAGTWQGSVADADVPALNRVASTASRRARSTTTAASLAFGSSTGPI